MKDEGLAEILSNVLSIKAARDNPLDAGILVKQALNTKKTRFSPSSLCFLVISNQNKSHFAVPQTPQRKFSPVVPKA